MAKKKAKKKPLKKSSKKKKPSPKKAKKSVKKSVKRSAKKASKKKSAGKKITAKKASSKTKTPKKLAARKTTASKKTSASKAPAAKTPAIPSTHPWIGKSLPDFTLENQVGSPINLGELTKNNSKVVLYFYPKDDTPGCTTEACGFRDNFSRAEALGAKVLGVSPDSAESHQKFIGKYNLNFDLLADTDHKLAEALGVWKLKKFMGREYMGIERSTFLIHNGNVVKAWQPVKVDGHVEEVISEAEKISS